MLQCSNCKEYPVLKEGAQEDAAAEYISFHTYKYKVSLRKDSKEHRQLELVQKRTKICKFCCHYYCPALCCGWYHVPFHQLHASSVVRLRQQPPHLRQEDAISFNKEIQSGYYQNTLVSVKGALLEWVNWAGATHTCYFGHWSEDSKQDAIAAIQNMHASFALTETQHSLSIDSL